jgi:NIMA (never in mitosis gene a)-related kinase
MDQKREYTLEDFVLQKKIGEGSFGSVYRASNLSTGETVAIKKIKLSAANRAEIKNVAHEVRVLCSIDHRHVVSYKGSFWDKGQTHICIVMEYLGGGDLSVKIANLKKKRQLMAEDQIWTYFIQMLKGLKVLHDLKIIHRDIKAANVFLTQDEREVKLGDMNVSKVVEKDFTKTRVGTPLYFSPEIWNGRSYDYKTDVWSLGCLLYEMAALTYPFNGNSMNDLRFCASKGRYAPIPSMYSKDLNEIIRQCLQVDDSKRPTVTKLLDSPIIRERVKRIDNLTVTDLKNVESKLIDTIQIPFDFRKIKLPMKKDIIQGKRSNSISNIRHSRPSTGRGDQDKENNGKFR